MIRVANDRTLVRQKLVRFPDPLADGSQAGTCLDENQLAPPRYLYQQLSFLLLAHIPEVRRMIIINSIHTQIVLGMEKLISDSISVVQIILLSPCLRLSLFVVRTFWMGTVREVITRKKTGVLLYFVQMRGWGRALPKFFGTFS